MNALYTPPLSPRPARLVATPTRASQNALAELSHELKTPLVALLGFAQLLESDAAHPLALAQRLRAEHIEQASRQMLAVVNELLAAARASTRGSVGLPG